MEQTRITLILFLLNVFGTVLLLVGVFTPGWSITSSKNSDAYTGYGLWYYRECDSNGDCETTSFHDDYKDLIDSNPQSSAGIQYASTVGNEVISLLSLIGCIVACVLIHMIHKGGPNKDRLALLTTCVLFTSGALIWTLIGQYAATTAARQRYLDSRSSTSTTMGFPYSVFLSAIGSALTLLVAVVIFYNSWKGKQPLETVAYGYQQQTVGFDQPQPGAQYPQQQQYPMQQPMYK